jgi:V/A-type H+-transporting ATPase subunit F
MKAFLISDNIDTLAGLHIAGINGTVVHLREEILAALDKALSDSEIGMIIITELAGERIKDKVDEIKLSRKLPLIVEIPDRHGSRKGRDYMMEYIRDSIGLKIEEGGSVEHRER